MSRFLLLDMVSFLHHPVYCFLIVWDAKHRFALYKLIFLLSWPSLKSYPLQYICQCLLWLTCLAICPLASLQHLSWMSICTTLQVFHLLPCLFTVIATFIIGTSFEVETISFSDVAFNVFFVVICVLLLFCIVKSLHSTNKYTNSAKIKFLSLSSYAEVQ